MPLFRLLTTDEGNIANLHVKAELKEVREVQEVRPDTKSTCSTDADVAGVDKTRAATPARVGSAKPSVAQNSSGQRAFYKQPVRVLPLNTHMGQPRFPMVISGEPG